MNNIEHILGIILPMLMSGRDVSTILRQLSGAGGSASYDGLQSMITQRNISLQRAMPARHSADLIQQHASGFLSNLGINPFTGAGQGIAMNMVHAYSFAPDIVGAMIGLPNAQSLYQQIANDAVGINVASGRGNVDIFNPYSAQSAYQNAIRMGRVVGKLASPDEHGYNISFTHGLNMDEIGKVSQRLLSTSWTYQDDKGQIDPDDEAHAQRFKDRLEKLGSKFNSTVSMLTKLTGSVDESIRLMDQLAGGNFLGGSEQDAIRTANRARHMAATIRVTSAMAGMDPKEAYQQMQATQTGLVMRSGLTPDLADASGYSGVLMHQAANATMSYNIWAANHPNATQQQRNQAMMATQARTMQYASTNGEALVAMVSAHKDLFTQEERDSIIEAYRRGDPDSIREMVQQRMGARAYFDYMNDPAAIAAFKMGGDQEFQKQAADAATEGNLLVASFEGGRRTLSNNLARTDSELERATGDIRFRSKDRDKAATTALKDLAVREFGLTEGAAEGKDIEWLQNYLQKSGADTRIVERYKHSAEIGAQLKDINDNEMSPEQEREVKTRLSSFIDTLGLSDDEKNKLKNQVNMDGANLNAIYGNLVNRFGLDYDTKILGGKLSKAEAERMRQGLEGDRKFWDVNATKDELKLAVDSMADMAGMFGTMPLVATMADKEFTDAKTSDQDAFNIYDERVQALREKGTLPEETAERSAEIRREAIGNVVKNALDLDEKGKNTKSILDGVSAEIDAGLKDKKNPRSIQASVKAAIAKQLKRTDLTENERKRLEQLQKETDDPNSDFMKERLNRTTVVSEETTLRNKDAAKKLQTASEGLFKALDSKDANAGADFYKYANQMAESGMFDKKALEGIDQKTLNTQSGRMAALEKLVPDAVRKRMDGIRTSLGTTDGDPKSAALAYIVSQAEKNGADQKTIESMIRDKGKEWNWSEDEIAAVVQKMDDTQAEKTSNAISNAINFGKGGFSDKEVEKGKEIAKQLQDVVAGNGLDAKTLSNLNSDNEETRNAAREKVRQQLAGKYKDDKEGLDYAVNYAAAFAGGSFDHDSNAKTDKVSGIDILTKGTELSKVDQGDMLKASKQAYQKDSSAYEILTVTSSILEMLSQMFGLMQGLQGIVAR